MEGKEGPCDVCVTSSLGSQLLFPVKPCRLVPRARCGAAPQLGEVGEIFFTSVGRARLDLRRLNVGTFPNKLREACRSAANMAKLSSKNCESVTFLQPANR
jgi:hypothetical protein